MTDLAQMKSDMTTFLAEWGESLTRKRLGVTYDTEGKATEDWNSSDLAITGDYQPLSGSDIRAESGRTDKSEGKMFVDFDDDILSGDRILRGSVTWHVNYTRDHEDHQVIFVRKLRNA